MSICLDPDQDLRCVSPDLAPNCLQRFQQATKDAASMVKVKEENILHSIDTFLQR